VLLIHRPPDEPPGIDAGPVDAVAAKDVDPRGTPGALAETV
jgi:hypothetical protein